MWVGGGLVDELEREHVRVAEQHARVGLGEQRLAHLDEGEEEGEVAHILDHRPPAHHDHWRLRRLARLRCGILRRRHLRRVRRRARCAVVSHGLVVSLGQRAEVELVQHLHEARHELAEDAVAHGEPPRLLVGGATARERPAVAPAARAPPAEAGPLLLCGRRRLEERLPQLRDVLAPRGGGGGEDGDEQPRVDEGAKQLLERAALVEQREQQLLQRAGVAPLLDRHERAELAQQQLQQLVQRLHRVGVDGGQLVEHLRKGLEEGGQLLRAHLRPLPYLLDVARGARLEEVVGARAEVMQLLLQQRLVAEDPHRPGERAHPAHQAPQRVAVAVARQLCHPGHHAGHVLTQVRVHCARALQVRGLGRRLAEQPRDPLEHLFRHLDRVVANVAVLVVAELQQRRHEHLHTLQEQARPEPRRRVGKAAVALVVAREEPHVAAEHCERGARHREPLELLFIAATVLLHHVQALDGVAPHLLELQLRGLHQLQQAVEARERAGEHPRSGVF